MHHAALADVFQVCDVCALEPTFQTCQCRFHRWMLFGLDQQREAYCVQL